MSLALLEPLTMRSISASANTEFMSQVAKRRGQCASFHDALGTWSIFTVLQHQQSATRSIPQRTNSASWSGQSRFAVMV